jgi:hypothetical protein
MLALYAENEPIDVLTVSNRLRAHNNPKEAGGEPAVDSRMVHLEEPIKHVGTYMVVVELDGGATATVKTMVVEQSWWLSAAARRSPSPAVPRHRPATR